MEKYLKQHLEKITAESFREWKETAFLSFASSTGRGGGYELGVCGSGKYCVKSRRNEPEYFEEPQAAIDRYAELLNTQFAKENGIEL
jgi:hypothetical protein